MRGCYQSGRGVATRSDSPRRQWFLRVGLPIMQRWESGPPRAQQSPAISYRSALRCRSSNGRSRFAPVSPASRAGPGGLPARTRLCKRPEAYGAGQRANMAANRKYCRARL